MKMLTLERSSSKSLTAFEKEFADNKELVDGLIAKRDAISAERAKLLAKDPPNPREIWRINDIDQELVSLSSSIEKSQALLKAIEFETRQAELPGFVKDEEKKVDAANKASAEWQRQLKTLCEQMLKTAGPVATKIREANEAHVKRMRCEGETAPSERCGFDVTILALLRAAWAYQAKDGREWEERMSLRDSFPVG
jgi:hypothetical protein